MTYSEDVPSAVGGRKDYRADDGVQSGRITAAREEAYSHRENLGADGPRHTRDAEHWDAGKIAE